MWSSSGKVLHSIHSMKHSLLFPFTISLLALLLTACSSPAQKPPTTVSTVDLERYQGLWYELARYENFFEAGCVGVTANYTLQGDRILIQNRCYDGAGRLKAQKKAEATVMKGSNGSKLKIYFSWFSDGNYWVLMLADDYRYAVVGDPKQEYLWILSRSTVLTDSDREDIMSKLLTLGYDPLKLYWTGMKASCNASSMH